MRDFLEIPYDQLEEMNLQAKQQRLARASMDSLREERLSYLRGEKRIKAVTVCFTDLEGRLHMLDYDKKFLLKSVDNLTFDGSSIRGFSQQVESDLRLVVDWSAFYWLPSDVFGPGKVLVFGEVMNRDGTPYEADMRGLLKRYTQEQFEKNGFTFNLSNEIEGFLFKGRHAEQHFCQTGSFEMVTSGGYYHSLPGDPLRQFIDTVAEVQRALGFANEKDHPEVAPSQFEVNYSYAEALIGIARLYRALKDDERAISFYLRALREVPQREDVHRDLMSLYDQRGEPDKAVRQYEILAGILERSLNITPSKITQAMFKQIRERT